jgi:thymidine kinase
MFSCKTTELLRQLTTLADVGYRVLYINYGADVRKTEAAGDNVSTHHSQFKGVSNKLETIMAYTLKEVDISQYDAIGVDEGQFFPDLEEYGRKWVLDCDKNLYVASLNGDFRRKIFGQAPMLLCLCGSEEVIMLSAYCMKCLTKLSSSGKIKKVPAPFTGKIGGNLNAQTEIGAKDKYLALCAKCHSELLQSSEVVVIPTLDLDSIESQRVEVVVSQ